MNELKNLAEFKKALSSYQISEEGKQVLKRTRLVLLVAPSASGRNSIIRELVRSGDYHFVVSDTTRKPRIQDGELEQNGTHYWFRTEDEVLADLKAGKFLEAAIIHNQQVSGISIRELEIAARQHRIAITDIEVVGVDNVLKDKPDSLAIFVLPPSFAEWQRRIRERGEMPTQEYRRRLESAVKELAAALEHDYYKFVINDTISHAAKQVRNITVSGTTDDGAQKEGLKLAERLYNETRKFLQSNN